MYISVYILHKKYIFVAFAHVCDRYTLIKGGRWSR